MNGPVPLDEYPIHQIPRSLAYVGPSDRNFYDRWYFNAHDRTGEVFLVTGMGVYPNLGVTDAFATIRRGTTQCTVRMSDALGDDRLHPRVGPYRIEVIEPLQRIRLLCEAEEHGLGFDLTWEGSFPAVEEQPHLMRQGRRPILDACRFAQVGSWSGWVKAGSTEYDVTPDTWIGTRDRSWGIRPVGEPEPAGRPDQGGEGFWWLYVPLRFEDFAVVVIVQEQPDGFRTLNDATRVWPDGTVEQLGWPRVEIGYRSGTRHPENAVLHLSEKGGSPATIEIDTLGLVALNVGTGYGGDPEWGHGRWMGESWCEGSAYDLDEPAIAGRIPFGVVDHVARAWWRDSSGETREGWGMFEHASIGRHDPTGFADWSSVAI